MATVSSTTARQELAELIGRVRFAGERIRITRRDKPVAVLISAEDLDLLEALEDARDLADVRRAEAEDDGTRVTHEDLKEELGLR